MSLAQRIVTEKRAVMVPLVAGLLVNAAVYAAGVYPLQGRVAAADSRASMAARDLRAAEQQAAQARNTVAGKSKASTELTRFYTEILPVDQTSARRMTYVRLAELAKKHQLKYARRTFEEKLDEHSALARLEMTMNVQGSYANIRRFIHELETSREFVVISAVGLAQSDDEGAPLELGLELATYYRARHAG